jgi:adenosyl cobinamide kinase/adenosyl cobinamide phosphate guanylyltransferase
MILVAAGVVASLLAHRHSPAVVVSNEVGLGIVPANQLARRFRDTLGAVNVTFAEHADRTAFLVAGRVQELSPATEFLESVTWQAPPPAST